MENNVFYCDEWHWGFFRGPKNLLSEEDAYLRHKNGELYTALIASSDNPDYVVTLRQETNFFAVEFVDKYGRNYLTHHFQKYPNSERYYLSMAVWREYMSLDSHEIAEGETYFFNAENDECHILKEDFIQKERYEKIAIYPQEEKVILFPEFGQYEEILNPDII